MSHSATNGLALTYDPDTPLMLEPDEWSCTDVADRLERPRASLPIYQVLERPGEADLRRALEDYEGTFHRVYAELDDGRSEQIRVSKQCIG